LGLTGVLGSDVVMLNDPTGGTYDTIHVGTGKTVTVPDPTNSACSAVAIAQSLNRYGAVDLTGEISVPCK
jgi:hypothetical protein